ncbi:MAG: hypothetical protein WBF47_15465, partial [Xanthobacteraceae bacterium]
MENVALDDSGAVQLDAVAVDRAFDAAADAHIVGDDIAFDIGALGDQHLVTVPSPEIFPTIVMPALIEDVSPPPRAAPGPMTASSPGAAIAAQSTSRRGRCRVNR